MRNAHYTGWRGFLQNKANADDHTISTVPELRHLDRESCAMNLPAEPPTGLEK